jgi:hypothetical protein
MGERGSGFIMRSNNKISFFEIVCIESQREYIEIVNYQEGIIINHAGCAKLQLLPAVFILFPYFNYASTGLQL